MIRSICYQLALPFYILVFNNKLKKCKTQKSIFDLTEKCRIKSLNVNSWQNSDEILGMLEAVSSSDIKAVLEIGTADGGTLFLLSTLASPVSG
tara:strand:- start:290 stop:568 length:279 start_codon:yes stop_codon:yes gene_type:complete